MLDASGELQAHAVPLVDLRRVNEPVRSAVLARFEALIERGEFGTGATVSDFEARFARYCGSAACAGTSSGLDAIRLALQATGLERGAEVLVPANTFAATFEAISQAGGVPVPIDVTTDDYNVDTDAAAAAVSRVTQAILPVHLYGQLADMGAVAHLAEQHDLIVVEDACQAHGARRAGMRPGHASDAAAFSFYPTKNLGAMGDAGAVVSNDPAVVEHVRLLREHGQRRKHVHEQEGWTARLDAFQAAVLLEKLEYLDKWNAERREMARQYIELLYGVGDLGLPAVAPASEPVWHVFPVATHDPDGLGDFLRGRGVQTGRHYPQPPHLSPAYAYLGYAPGSFPVTERLAASLLSLPIYPGMIEAQVNTVVAGIRAYFANG